MAERRSLRLFEQGAGLNQGRLRLLNAARAGARRCSRARLSPLRIYEGKIEDRPHADFGEGFDSPTLEHHIYDYFGVALDAERELRVIHEGHDLPGLQTVTSK
jgi:hypothetical protein